MSASSRWLGLDRERWERVGPESVWTALAVVLVAAVLLALARFGGLAGDAPRAFVRLTLVTVWGWIGLSAALAALAALFDRARTAQLRTMLAVAGLAHVPLLATVGVVIMAAVMLQQLGPGLVVAAFSLVFWFPARLVRGLGVTQSLPTSRAIAVVTVPYVAWLAIVARHTVGQIEHLL